MTCISGACGAQSMNQTMGLGGAGGIGAAGAAGADPTAAGGAGKPGDLMTMVMDILRKMGLDGGQETGAMSKDDLMRLMKALQQMGPQGMKQVLSQNPQLTQMLGQALNQAPGATQAA